MHPIGRQLSSMNLKLTLEKLEELAHQFVDDCKNQKNEEIGWPKTAYGTAKLMVNCITRIYA